MKPTCPECRPRLGTGAIAAALLTAALLRAAPVPAAPPAQPPPAQTLPAPPPAQSAHRPPTAAEVLAASTAADWRALDPQITLYLQLATGRVVIELMPQFAPNHVANVLALTRGNYFDGAPITRAQDDYVVQWGDPDGKT